jgi:hypothetical protein
MRQVSMATRDELVTALAARYARASRTERGRILDEFVAVTGYHRKHAMRVVRSGQPGRRSGPRLSMPVEFWFSRKFRAAGGHSGAKWTHQ